MRNLKKSDIELIITVLGGVLLGLVVFISTTSLSEMLVLQKSSLLGVQFLEGVYLTNYFFWKEAIGKNKVFTKEDSFIYEINTDIPITSLEIGNNGFKINNFCFSLNEESSKTLFVILTGSVTIGNILVTIITAETKVKDILEKLTTPTSISNFIEFYNYLQIFLQIWSYLQSKSTIFIKQKICILKGDRLITKIENIKTIIKKDKKSNKIGKNLVFKAYLENKNLIIEVGVK